MPNSRALTASVLLTSILGCGHDTTAPPDLVPASLDIVSGQEQTGRVGEELPSPLVVRVFNSEGQAVAGQVVNFRVVKGGGDVFAGAAVTNADGMAQERWTLGQSIADSQVVEVRAVDPASGAPIVFARFIATALAGPPEYFTRDFGYNQAGMAGSTLREALQVFVRDRYLNPVANATISWAASAGTLAHGTSVTDAAGHTSNSWTLGASPGTQIVTASTANGLSAQFPARSVSQAELLFRVVGGNDQTATPGTAVALAPWVLVMDGQDTRFPDIPVTFAVIKGAGTVTGGSPVTDETGTARVGSWVLGSQVGVNLLSATLPSGTSTTLFARAVQKSSSVLARIVGNVIGDVVGDDVPLRVNAQSSSGGIASVTATVSGKTTNLGPLGALGQPDWGGTLSLAGTPQDTMTVIVTVTDKAGNISQDANLWTHRSP